MAVCHTALFIWDTLQEERFLFVNNLVAIKISLLHDFQAKKTASIVHKIANQYKFGGIKSKAFSFSHQLLHRFPEFSCGLFAFDLSLAFKVIHWVM